MHAARLSVLEELENEAIFVMREVFGQFERPVLLFSGGKDSIVLVHLAKKAFSPAAVPFPVLHIDTGHNFPETIEFRDRFVERMGVRLLVGSVQQSIDTGRVVEEQGPNASRNVLQTVTLLDTLQALKADAAMGGARRDEEKARAKERFFSHRDSFGQWDPKNQRPEVWRVLNGAKAPGEHFRVFPLNNWTELDVWRYIEREGIELPSLYFSHRREMVHRSGVLLAKTPFLGTIEGEASTVMQIRFRTIGDATCTGGIESAASSIEEVILELEASRLTERATRGDDKRSQSAMEDRKRQGYF